VALAAPAQHLLLPERQLRMQVGAVVVAYIPLTMPLEQAAQVDQAVAVAVLDLLAVQVALLQTMVAVEAEVLVEPMLVALDTKVLLLFLFQRFFIQE
jgi:hypothetical protein